MEQMAVNYLPDSVQVCNAHFVHGQRNDEACGQLPVLRPSDGRQHALLPEAGAAVVDAAVASALKAQAQWRQLPPRERGRLMRRWSELVTLHAAEIAQLESLVSSRPYHEALAVDVPGAAEWLRYYGEYADKLEGTVTASSEDKLSLILREPYGVVGIITPWNFPLFLASWKLAPAIAAGNAVVLKPSELTPFSIVRVAELAVEAGLPPGLLNIVHGTGPITGHALVSHRDVSYVSFTGSTAVGARIMSDAALAGIKPVSLELGGKSPALVFDDCGDLDAVADHVTWGITRNAGQLCYAGSRLVVAQEIADALLEKVASRMAALRFGPTWHGATSMPPIISQRQCERIATLVGQSVDAGARLTAGGQVHKIDGGHFFEPTVLDHVQAGTPGHMQEIFGPVLAVQRFNGVEQGLALANHPDYGLSASVFTRDIDRALHASRQLKAGTIWVNRWGRTPEMTSSPFGGYGQSGFGKESGKPGIENFLRSKSVWVDFSGRAELSQGGKA
jgi:aldehyde dehydrogenase (NAD+)